MPLETGNDICGIVHDAVELHGSSSFSRVFDTVHHIGARVDRVSAASRHFLAIQVPRAGS